MKKITLLYLGLSLLLSSCGNDATKESVKGQPEEIAVFSSTDPNLQKSFDWAKEKALSYAHDSDDPVGPWYEAALPQREAFCMRDVSHQSVGAHILGLLKHNKNMMRKFARNINECRDYCSFWEINRYDKPAPADYASDTEFWYNLNANFDVMQACLKMYEWTADKDYISDKDFTNFYDLSVNEYLDRWQLRPDMIMDRPPYMNQPADFNEANNFHSCRGLPSYVENFRGLTLGVDLLAALHGGFNAYSKMASFNGDASKAAEATSMANAYREIIDSKWWDEENRRFNTFWTTEKKFYRGEGVPFILWFDATGMTDRKNASVEDILSREWNVENMSAFPALFYDLGYNEEAYRFLTTLPSTNRSEYPEVSYGLVEGIVCGAMGLKPSASDKSISSVSRVDGNVCEIKNVPVFDGFISLRHDGMKSSEIKNDTDTDLMWHASFMGNHDFIESDGEKIRTTVTTDVKGNTVSSVMLRLPKNSQKSARVI
uniref:Uncharacterized protein n=1 Tax=uncultured Muribaculaceae bacterium TaxID=2301481 RepID=A0A6G8F3M5_9BACT|nr:hypothetical protein Muribac1_0990 [uncultured Muribaculaceae bacterium]